MRLGTAYVLSALLLAACGGSVNVGGGSGGTGGGTGGSGTGGSGTGGSGTGGADPCSGLELPTCPPACPDDYHLQCGTPCAGEGKSCGNEIGDGMTCAGGTWQCSIHPPLGGPGECNLLCRPLCAAMDAAGEGACDMFLGWAWDGKACIPLGGCSCAGDDCYRLWQSEEACAADHAPCTSGDPCAFKSCGDACNPCPPGEDCPAVESWCDAAGQCGQAFPVCEAACKTDADCVYGAEWCVVGSCVPCDNGGLACDIDCGHGYQTYERNGCFPCDCAPPNACTSDAACPASPDDGPGKCYAGKFCWDWCPPGDPSCCYGNTCSQPGCQGPNPVGCWTTGCPLGQHCSDDGCAPSSCGCSGSDWACTDDCGGGTCVGGGLGGP